MSTLMQTFSLKLKIGKTTRPFRYDLNQVPDNYTVEVTDRPKGLDLVDRAPEVLWMEVSNTIQGAVIKTILKKKKCKKAKWLFKETLQIAEERRGVKSREKGTGPNECRVTENSKERLEGLLN